MLLVVIHVHEWVTPYCQLTWHRLLFAVSTLRFLTSGEAALRRLLASRVIGGYSWTSDDPALGSLTEFQSSRVALPQDASKAVYLVSLLSCSARSYLSTNRQRMRLLTYKPDWDRPVDSLIQSSSTVIVTTWVSSGIW